MSENQNNGDDPRGREDAGSETDTANGDSNDRARDSDADAPAERRSGSRGPAWLALLLALGALALATRPFWPASIPGAPQPASEQPAAADEGLRERMDALQQRIDSLQQPIESLQEADSELRQSFESADEALRSELSSLNERLARRSESDEQASSGVEQSVDSLGQRLDRLESRFNEAEGRLTARVDDLEQRLAERLARFDSRLSRVGDERDRQQQVRASRLQLAEVDWLVTMARHRLDLGNVDAARRAWQWALDEIDSLQGSRYAALREAARADFERLRDYRPPSRHQQAQRLLQIADSVNRWPSNAIGSPPVSGSGGESGSEPDGETAGWRGRIGGVFSRLVRVESVDPDQPGLADVARLRTTVRARLETAALALARGDTELLRVLLNESVERIEHAFAGDAPEVASALETLRAIDSERPEPPSLSATRQRLDELLEADE